MALLGARKPQKFGQIPQQMTPLQVYGDGSTPATMQTPNVANMPDMGGMQAQQPAKFKPNLLGVIGDAMQVFGGGQATYMQGVREQQLMAEKMRQRALEAQQERETSWQDYVRKFDYERENAAPKKSQFDLDLEASDLPIEQQVILRQQRVQNQANPMQAVKTYDAEGNETLQFIRPSAMQGQTQSGLLPIGGVLPPKAGGSAGNGTGGFRTGGY